MSHVGQMMNSYTGLQVREDGKFWKISAMPMFHTHKKKRSYWLGACHRCSCRLTMSLAMNSCNSTNLYNLSPKESGDSFHDVVCCTKSQALRMALRLIWDLPDEANIVAPALAGHPIFWIHSSDSNEATLNVLILESLASPNDTVFGKGGALVPGSV